MLLSAESPPSKSLEFLQHIVDGLTKTKRRGREFVRSFKKNSDIQIDRFFKIDDEVAMGDGVDLQEMGSSGHLVETVIGTRVKNTFLARCIC